MTKIATDGGIKWICVLLESEHVLMINDGLIALCLLAATKNGKKCNVIYLDVKLLNCYIIPFRCCI